MIPFVPDDCKANSTNTSKKNLFVAGFGIAMVEVMKLHHEDAIVKDVCENSGFTLDHFKAAGLDADDLQILAEALS